MDLNFTRRLHLGSPPAYRVPDLPRLNDSVASDLEIKPCACVFLLHGMAAVRAASGGECRIGTIDSYE